jgi:diadenosine tetraphosphate (Ap4A) HIT family hydrolase
MRDWKRDRIASAERRENPTVLARMPSGFAVLGDTQFLPGYCLLLAVPHAVHLTDMPVERRVEFLRDMSLLGEAVQIVCRPSRINYEIAGNVDPFVHAHVIPRYAWEPEQYRYVSAALYPPERRNAHDEQFNLDRHGELMLDLRECVTALLERLDNLT